MRWHHDLVKRALVLALVVLTALPLFADPRAEKSHLIAELLEIIDAKSLTQASFDAIFETMSGMRTRSSEDVPEEYRAQWEATRKAQEEEMRVFRERFFTRIDYVKYADQTYVPLFDKQFNADELKELIAFFKTKAGQKMVKLIPDLGVGAMAKGQALLESAAKETQEELEKEDAAKHPWKKTMADIRTIATALEARATDTDEYPKASFEQLEGLLQPTYIREIPKVDVWGTSYVYVGDGEHYRIVSAGADRTFEWSSRQIELGAEARSSKNADTDIVFQDGIFIQFPADSKPAQ